MILRVERLRIEGHGALECHDRLCRVSLQTVDVAEPIVCARPRRIARDRLFVRRGRGRKVAAPFVQRAEQEERFGGRLRPFGQLAQLSFGFVDVVGVEQPARVSDRDAEVRCGTGRRL